MVDLFSVSHYGNQGMNVYIRIQESILVFTEMTPLNKLHHFTNILRIVIMFIRREKRLFKI